MEIVDTKADVNEIKLVHERMDAMPSKKEVREVRVDLFD
jgi:hypothetical protein